MIDSLKLPFALQVSVTLVPSRTTMSLLVIDSTIIGGTVIKLISFFCQKLDYNMFVHVVEQMNQKVIQREKGKDVQ